MKDKDNLSFGRIKTIMLYP